MSRPLAAAKTRLRPATPRPRRWILIEPLLAVVLWGGIYPGARIALREIAVVDFTFLRLVLATAVLAAVWLPRRRPVPRGFWRLVVLAGIAQAAFQITLVAGLRWTTAGQSAILLAASPILTAGWLALRGDEILDGRRWTGLAIGLGGVALVVGGSPGGLDASRMLGDLLGLGAAAAWSWYGFAVSPVVAAAGTWQATGWAMGIAMLFFAPIALHDVARSAWDAMSWQAWAGLAYGGTAGMVVAMALWGRSLHRFGQRQTMVYVYLEPVSAVVFAAVLLGESLSIVQAVGALLTFAGVWLASGPAGAGSPQSPPACSPRRGSRAARCAPKRTGEPR
jgi:drug/metabolite transporter (DMT)-like permease